MKSQEVSERLLKAKTISLIVCLAWLLPMGMTNDSYSPQSYTWELREGTTGTVVATYEGISQPVFNFDLCQLWGLGFDPTWGGAKYTCRDLWSSQILTQTQFYGCPSSGSPECQGNGAYYCAQWSCVSFAPWVNIDSLISFAHQPQLDCKIHETCNNITIKVKQDWYPSHSSTRWDVGLTWGLRAYVKGYDPGVLFTIQRVKQGSKIH